MRVRALTNVRGAAGRMLDVAATAVDQCVAWFGAFPEEELELAQSDAPLDATLAFILASAFFLSRIFLQPTVKK